MGGGELWSAHTDSSLKGVFPVLMDAVTELPRNMELTVHVHDSGSALIFCTEELTGPANGVYPMGRGAGDRTLCSDLLGILSLRWSRRLPCFRNTCLIIGNPLIPQEQELKGLFKYQTSY